ncbi:MAG TPA: hypothetical protein VHN37_08730 [Actinomycetota bacterium]|nr:hypothetical protein [Actinomycetota bacterium]
MRADLVDARAVPPAPGRELSPEDAAALVSSLDPDVTAGTAARVLLEVAGARSCGVWRLEAGIATAIGSAVAPDGRPVPGFAGRAEHPSPAIADAVSAGRGVRSDAPPDRTLAPAEAVAVLVLPLPGDAAVVAALDADEHRLRSCDGALASACASAGAALSNAYAYARQRAALAAAQHRVERLEAAHAEGHRRARDTALAHERDRIAARLHDTAGQLFVAIALLARHEAEGVPAATDAAARWHRLADLADQGKWQIDHAVDALAFFPAARHGLAPALRSLASSFHVDGELDVIVDVYGPAVRLGAAVERALYRVVHEWLADARRSRSSVVRVVLAFDGDVVRLEVADDGTGLTETIPDRGRPGTNGLRRTVADVGGSFHIRNADPCGVRVEVRVPRAKP